MWGWPDNVPVPAGLQNVFLYKAESVDPQDRLGRFAMVIRRYGIQPGITPIDEEASATLYDTSNLQKPLRCNFNLVSGLLSLGVTLLRSGEFYGIGSPSQAWRDLGNNVLSFSRAPKEFVPVPEGWDADGSSTYLSTVLDTSKINVVTMHKVPTYYDNTNLGKNDKFGVYETRFMSFVLAARWPIRDTDTVNQNTAIYAPDGSWIVVALPQNPELSPEQEMQARAKAAMLNYNVIGGGPLEKFSPLEPGTLAVRYKTPGDFPGTLLNMASWVDPNDPETADNDYRNYNTAGVDDPGYFDKFQSLPTNMGPWWIDGVTETFDEFMTR